MRAKLLQLLNMRCDGKKKAFAQAINMPASTVQRWFDGTASPKPNAIRKIAEAFGVSEAWLLGGDEGADTQNKNANANTKTPVVTEGMYLPANDRELILVLKERAEAFERAFNKLSEELGDYIEGKARGKNRRRSLQSHDSIPSTG